MTIKSQQTEKCIFNIKLIAAFGAIYFVWGSTYLGIRFALESFPPFIMAGIRFSIAGIMFFIWGLLRYKKLPNLYHWKKSAVTGILMFVIGHGCLSWSEQFIPSGMAALIVATIPIWMVLLDWVYFTDNRPDILTFLGIGLGLIGVTLLLDIDKEILINSTIRGRSVIQGVFILTFGAIAWAAGSLYSRTIKSTLPFQFNICIQVIVGGFVLSVIGLLRGEWTQLSVETPSLRSISALVYLILFGTLITYSAYMWLLKVSTPVKVGTYAFFNPLIALVLGYLLANESFTMQILLGACCILIALLMVNLSKFHRKNSS